MEASAAAAEEHAATRTTLETLAETSDKLILKALTKDTKLGNMLAKSNLPDAIVAAQIKQQIASLALAAGLSEDDASKAVDQYMTEGTYTTELNTAIKGLDETARRDLAPAIAATGGLAGGVLPGSTAPQGTPPPVTRAGRRIVSSGSGGPIDTEEVAHDFIYQGDGGARGTLTPIDGADTVVGAKPGGPLDRAGGGGGGTVNISIYGGDERAVFDVVKRVLRESGIGPGRVTARA